MDEDSSQDVLLLNSAYKTRCAAAQIHFAYPGHSAGRRTEERRPRKPAKPAVICNPRATRAVVVRGVRELETFSLQWIALAGNAADSNVFYEPWWLLPSLRHLHSGRDVLFLLVFARDPDSPTSPEILCGMFPFELALHYRGLPARVLRLLRPTYNRLCTPLVHRELVTESVRALLDWAEQNSENVPLIEFRFIAGEGRVAQELTNQRSALGGFSV